MANDALARAATSVFGESNLPATRSVFTPAAFGQAIDIRQRAALAKKYVDSAAGLYDFETKLRDQQLQRRQQGLKAADVQLEEQLLPVTQDTAIKTAGVKNALATESASTVDKQIEMLRLAQKADTAEFNAKIAEQEQEAKLLELQPQILKQVESVDLKDPAASETFRSLIGMARDPQIKSRLIERSIVADTLSRERDRFFRAVRGLGLSEDQLLETENALTDAYLGGDRSSFDKAMAQLPSYNELERQRSEANKAADKEVKAEEKQDETVNQLKKKVPPGETSASILESAKKLLPSPDVLKEFASNPKLVAARFATLPNGSGTPAKNPAHPELVVLAQQYLDARELEDALKEKMLRPDTRVAPSAPSATSTGSTPGGSYLEKYAPSGALK
jgi:hypothetical protein